MRFKYILRCFDLSNSVQYIWLYLDSFFVNLGLRLKDKEVVSIYRGTESVELARSSLFTVENIVNLSSSALKCLTQIETLYSSDPIQNYFLYIDMLRRGTPKEPDCITPDLIPRNTRHISKELWRVSEALCWKYIIFVMWWSMEK